MGQDYFIRGLFFLKRVLKSFHHTEISGEALNYSPGSMKRETLQNLG